MDELTLNAGTQERIDRLESSRDCCVTLWASGDKYVLRFNREGKLYGPWKFRADHQGLAKMAHVLGSLGGDYKEPMDQYEANSLFWIIRSLDPLPPVERKVDGFAVLVACLLLFAVAVAIAWSAR